MNHPVQPCLRHSASIHTRRLSSHAFPSPFSVMDRATPRANFQGPDGKPGHQGVRGDIGEPGPPVSLILSASTQPIRHQPPLLSTSMNHPFIYQSTGSHRRGRFRWSTRRQGSAWRPRMGWGRRSDGHQRKPRLPRVSRTSRTHGPTGRFRLFSLILFGWLLHVGIDLP